MRRPNGPFGWLEASLLHDHWLQRLQPDATAVLLLLALAADRRGASYYSRARMADRLGIDVGRVDHAVERLLALGLVELKPWRPGQRDGVWQIVPVEQNATKRAGACLSVAELLRSLGFAPTAGN
ncbi:MAG: hypothetical protein AB7I19_14315 [Planctomycetota bacterium]